MRASLKNKVAGSLAALAIGIGLASVVTPASAWFRGGFHGGFHGGWRGGYAWRGYGYGYGYYAGWRPGCGYGAWRCNGYWGAPVVTYAPAPVVGYVTTPAPIAVPAPAPVALADTPPPAPVAAPGAPNCNVVYRPAFDAYGNSIGTRAISVCQ
jgi:hypothetical protein